MALSKRRHYFFIKAYKPSHNVDIPKPYPNLTRSALASNARTSNNELGCGSSDFARSMITPLSETKI